MFFNWQMQIEPMARIAIAIFIEAAPFLLLGSILAAVIEVFVDQERLARLVPRNLIGGVALGVGAGMILPTCECGVVPHCQKAVGQGRAAVHGHDLHAGRAGHQSHRPDFHVRGLPGTLVHGGGQGRPGGDSGRGDRPGPGKPETGPIAPRKEQSFRMRS